MTNPEHKCERCDGLGSAETYANQACLPIDGKVVCIDWCIHQIVAALHAGGIGTVASCCGHGTQPGRIVLADGRTLTISRRDKLRPERVCDRCGGHNVIWFAPNELWNKVASDQWDILCPTCFVELSEAAGVKPAAWKIEPEKIGAQE